MFLLLTECKIDVMIIMLNDDNNKTEIYMKNALYNSMIIIGKFAMNFMFY